MTFRCFFHGSHKLGHSISLSDTPGRPITWITSGKAPWFSWRFGVLVTTFPLPWAYGAPLRYRVQLWSSRRTLTNHAIWRQFLEDCIDFTYRHLTWPKKGPVAVGSTQLLRVKMKWGQKGLPSRSFFFERQIASEASCWGIEHIRFPFFLGGARWLVFAKQVYALLLLPYVIPYMVLSYTTAILLAAWSILFTKCCWSLAAKSSDLWFRKKRHWSCRLFGQTISPVEQ